MHDAKTVGIYFFAFNLATQTMQVFTQNLIGVLFPRFRRLQDNIAHQTRAFLRAAELLAHDRRAAVPAPGGAGRTGDQYALQFLVAADDSRAAAAFDRHGGAIGRLARRRADSGAGKIQNLSGHQRDQCGRVPGHGLFRLVAGQNPAAITPPSPRQLLPARGMWRRR
jgi:hypothetical protein